jgi:hypothetical protein
MRQRDADGTRSSPTPARPTRLRQVGVREFRDRASQFLAGGEVLAIERHGKTIGFYIPVITGPTDESRRALAQLEQAVARVLARGAITEEELSRDLDLNQPFSDPQ